MNLRDAFSKLFNDSGIEVDPEEFNQLGIIDGEETEQRSAVLSESLPGRAAGELEIFLAADSTRLPATEKDGLIWAPIAREGQWALRPNGKGGKSRVPLKIVAGRSKDARRELGLQDVVDAFEDGAIEDVTVPETHANRPTENHGYIEKVKIVSGKMRDGSTAKVLMGGYNITEPKTKEKMLNGSVPNRSANFLYDYERTDTGKRYKVALEHVCLTPHAWLRGMPRFGRPVEALSDDFQTVALTLSDDGPPEDEYALTLATAEEDGDLLSQPSISWPQEDSPEWLKARVNDILEDARRKKVKVKRDNGTLLYEQIPHYRCIEAKPGSALITDNWGGRANSWVASISVKDGEVTLAAVSEWTATKQVYVPDERDTPKGDRAPLSDQTSTREQPRGGGTMAEESTLQLSEEARAIIKAAEDRAAAAEAEAKAATSENLKLSEKVDRLLGESTANEADRLVAELKAMGLDEEHGFSGMLAEVRKIALADDGGPAVQSEQLADDRNTTGELTITDALRRVFGAIKKGQDGKVSLSEIITPPTEGKEGEETAGATGKPPKGDEDEVDEAKLSDDEILARYEKEKPGVLAAAGIALADNNGSNSGGS